MQRFTQKEHQKNKSIERRKERKESLTQQKICEMFKPDLSQSMKVNKILISEREDRSIINSERDQVDHKSGLVIKHHPNRYAHKRTHRSNRICTSRNPFYIV